jgi:SNF2 family DNA or RNA helicase
LHKPSLIVAPVSVLGNWRQEIRRFARVAAAGVLLRHPRRGTDQGELWSLFDFVQPGLLGDRQTFQRHYRNPIENTGDARRTDALKRRVQPFLLR